MAGVITSNGLASFLQPAPAPVPSGSPSNVKSMTLVVGLSGVVCAVADLVRAAVDFTPDVFTAMVWPTVFESFAAAPAPGVLGAEIAAYSNAPWLWKALYRGSYSAFLAAAIVEPTQVAGTAFNQANAMSDAVFPKGAQVGLNIAQLNTIGFKLWIPDAATYPNAVMLVDFFMSRTTQ